MWTSFLSLLLRLSAGMASRWRNWKFRLLGVRIEGYCWLRDIEISGDRRRILLRPRCALDRGVTLLASVADHGGPGLVIESDVYINRGTIVDVHQHLVIERGTMIGPNCFITDADHGMEPGTPVRSQPLITAPVHIGQDVWLGAGVTVTRGVTIGDGAVIGAGSVVTRDVPANSVAAGVPARVIRSREVQGKVR